MAAEELKNTVVIVVIVLIVVMVSWLTLLAIA